MKKCMYVILIIITIIGAIIIGINGFNVDITYGKNARIDIFLGKEFNNEDIKQIAQEVFETNDVLVQKIEYYGNIAAITIKEQDEETINEKLETINAKINEKYGLEGKVEDIKVTHYPNAKLSSILNPYIWPIAISAIIILIYALIRYRKLNFAKVALEYILNIALTEGAYVGVIAITRVPINKIVIPIALLIYVFTVTITTVLKEKELSELKLKQEKK